MTVHLNPPKSCDLCGAKITDEFSDARHPRLGRWGNFCPSCSTDIGVIYGTGYGQRYRLNADGKFEKAEG